MNCHDDVAHLDTSDKGSTPENTARVVLMNQYYASCTVLNLMDKTSAGFGAVLDCGSFAGLL
jgi:hypothetical protein